MTEPFDMEQAEGWRPNPGDQIVGSLRSVETGWSDYLGGNYPILVIEPEGGGDAVSVHGFQTVLKDKILTQRPQPGARVGVKYHGKKPTRDGKREVALYTFRVEGQSADPYQSFGPVDDRTVAAAASTEPQDDESLPFD